MQLGNNRVWDYAGDNYVHRLIQNKADGKPVELEPRWVSLRGFPPSYLIEALKNNINKKFP